VPGGTEGPSGVLICSENYLTYKNFGDQPDIRCPIPRRRNDLDDPERGMLIVCSATHKTKSMFFFLAQTEQGDIFKITLETDDDMVSNLIFGIIGQKYLHLFLDSEAYHEQMGPIPSSNGSLDIALSNAHT